MKKTVLKEKSSTFIIGRGLIIIAILIPSLVSFILGYFVGKTTTRENTEIKQLQENLRNKEAPLNTQSQQQVQPQASDLSTDTELQTTGSQREAAGDTQQSQKPTKIVYTVQVGAFKDAPDADALKDRLGKKGYKTYTTLSESKREGRLYKVRIGEFSTRKEAEELSLKIKKAEGLQTFVTFKKEEESIRQP